MSALPPTNDDSAIWDIWLSQFRLPVVNVNVEVGTFQGLSDAPLSAAELAAQLAVDARALTMHLAALCAMGLVEKRLGKWRATHLARTWLHPDGAGYWGHSPARSMSTRPCARGCSNRCVPGNVRAAAGRARARLLSAPPSGNAAPCRRRRPRASPISCTPTARLQHWARRHRAFSASSLRSWTWAADRGVYGIEIARAHPRLKVALMDLKEMAAEAHKSISGAGTGRQVTTAGVTHVHRGVAARTLRPFLLQRVPRLVGRDRRLLARRSWDALPRGGRIFLNEILMDDDCTGPFLPPPLAC